MFGHNGTATMSSAGFTSKERDQESGLDYFKARYMASAEGSFTSPDPVGGRLANPQSLDLYTYVLNNPLRFTDPTGMIVEWSDSSAQCKRGETVCRTNLQRSYEDRLKQLRDSNDKKTHQNGVQLTDTYERLQQSEAVFEVTEDRNTGPNGGEITYQGDDHFTIGIHGNDNYGLTDNQGLAHEFEQGRQILDNGSWLPFADDLTDEA